jgi:type VI secretion system protein VasJ
LAAENDRALLGSTPIPGAKPAGESCRYDPGFEALNGEVEKIGSVTGAEIDWRVVTDNAIQILSQKSKDLTVAAYLTRALHAQEGYKGTREGLVILRDMIKTFWESMWPEASRMRARTSALQWLSDKLAPVIEKSPAGEPGIQPALDALKEVVAAAGEKFEAAAMPAMQPLVRAMESKVSGAVDSPAAEPEGTPAKAGGSPAAASGAPAGPVGGASEAYHRLEEVREFFRRTEPHNPVIYLIDRALRWRSMSLQDVVKEMLPDNRDVRNAIWQQLGLEREHD